MSAKTRRILITDDHLIIRYGTIRLIKEFMPDAIFFEASTLNQAKAIISTEDIDLLILDINIPGGDNIKMVEAIKVKWPGIKVLMFSGYPEEDYAMRYIQAGADGYVHKDTSINEIQRAVELVLAGKTFMSEQVKEHAINTLISRDNPGRRIDTLSNRELDVARHLINGRGTIEIAAALNLQMSTVSTYKKRLFEKLQVKNIIELIDRFQES
ncbi:response regulator transcription factor [Desertivirga xinjiangensis]|uniref:response regulator transcription factor n=1 Tax=Desertivirga xinjiangensis TaxID=539206 RepID=UPI0021087229|nr:response regulator transcription factor [Pedobacter xinjiangensis]